VICPTPAISEINGYVATVLRENRFPEALCKVPSALKLNVSLMSEGSPLMRRGTVMLVTPALTVCVALPAL
jgi:hypothetical protein